MEAILTGIFFFFGWIAGALVWWAYLLQTVILFVGYGLSPIFIGFLAIQSLHEVGRRYFLNLVGVMMWPLGWGVAGLVTQSMIDFMTDRTFLHANPLMGGDIYSFQNLMGVAFLGIWLIFSTIAAPMIIQKAIVNGSLAASDLLSGAFASGRTAVSTGATTLANVGTGVGGIGGAITAGVTSAAPISRLMSITRRRTLTVWLQAMGLVCPANFAPQLRQSVLVIFRTSIFSRAGQLLRRATTRWA